MEETVTGLRGSRRTSAPKRFFSDFAAASMGACCPPARGNVPIFAWVRIYSASRQLSSVASMSIPTSSHSSAPGYSSSRARRVSAV